MTLPKPLRKIVGMTLLLATAGLIPWVAFFHTLFG